MNIVWILCEGYPIQAVTASSSRQQQEKSVSHALLLFAAADIVPAVDISRGTYRGFSVDSPYKIINLARNIFRNDLSQYL